MLVNSETFLLSNMSPQHKDFNRKIWGDLEEARAEILKAAETYKAGK